MEEHFIVYVTSLSHMYIRKLVALSQNELTENQKLQNRRRNLTPFFKWIVAQ